MTLKVLGSTPNSTDPFLCETCSRAHFRTGVNNEKFVGCAISEEPVRFKVTQCSDYYKKTDPSLKSMEDIAYLLINKGGGKGFGFERFAKLKKDNPLVYD